MILSLTNHNSVSMFERMFIKEIDIFVEIAWKINNNPIYQPVKSHSNTLLLDFRT